MLTAHNAAYLAISCNAAIVQGEILHDSTFGQITEKADSIIFSYAQATDGIHIAVKVAAETAYSGEVALGTCGIIPIGAGGEGDVGSKFETRVAVRMSAAIRAYGEKVEVIN